MKIILLLVCALSGCAMTDATRDAFDVAVFNFRWEADVRNELRVYDTIDQPFRGDCEDFAFTLQKQVGGKVWVTRIGGNDGPADTLRYCIAEGHDCLMHAVLVKDNIVYDYIYGPRTVEDYPNSLLWWINTGGKWGLH